MSSFSEHYQNMEKEEAVRREGIGLKQGGERTTNSKALELGREAARKLEELEIPATEGYDGWLLSLTYKIVLHPNGVLTEGGRQGRFSLSDGGELLYHINYTITDDQTFSGDGSEYGLFLARRVYELQNKHDKRKKSS